MGELNRYLESELEKLERAALRRTLRVITSGQDTEVEFEGRQMLMMSSNNYLGLANHPAVRAAAQNALAQYGVGAGASRLIAGSLSPIHQLEAHLACFKGVEAALVFGSGYLANVGTISALVGTGDAIFSDELNHASLIDGCRLSRAAVHVYRHRDVRHLEELLQASKEGGMKLIVTDSVFSMDGDCAPLEPIVALARRCGAAVMIDEAHAVGVVGPHGAGLAAKLGLSGEIDVHMGTLSKALGAYGAYVAGSKVLIDFLVNRARTFIYSTGLAPALAAAADMALTLVETEPWRVAQLWENASYLRRALTAAGFTVAPTESPILPVMVGEPENALRLADALLARGVYVIAIRPPTVPPGTARLRVTPIASHSRADLERTVAAFAAAGREADLLHG
jgi:8-amino-7-oxononanoate synthase